LEHAHERGVCHRDLKPGNVLFDARGRVRLADFGVAATAMATDDGKFSVSTESSRDTNSHGLSPFTASPAQLRGDAPSPADDIYGLGALAYELLSGYPPYYPHFDRRRAIEDPVPDLVPTRQIPELLRTLVMRMLDKNPAKRPLRMREVIDDLDAALNDTLTFEFDRVIDAGRKPPHSTGAAAGLISANDAIVSSSVGGAGRPLSNVEGAVDSTPAAAAQLIQQAANPSPTWSATSGMDRRATPDRRQRRRTDAQTANTATETNASPEAVPTPAREAAAAPEISAGPGLGGNLDSSVTPQIHVYPPSRAESVPAADPLAPVAAAPLAPVTFDSEVSSGSGASIPLASSSPTVAASTVTPPASPVPPSQRAAPVPPPQYATPANNGGAERTPWADIPVDSLPRPPKLEPIRSRRWPWVVLGLLAGAAAAVFFWLPRFDLQSVPDTVATLIAPKDSSQSSSDSDASAMGAPAVSAVASQTASASAARLPTATPANSASTPSSTTASPAGAAAPTDERFRAMKQIFDSRLAMLEARGAGAWGGRDFAMAKTRAAESVGARDAGNASVAQDRLIAAARLLDAVESRAPQALTAQIAAGEKALGTGQQEVAGQAFQLAHRIDPNSRRASDGARRARNLNGVLPLLADAENAEAAHEYARAAQDYSQALSLDPDNVQARAGQARANAAFGDDTYAKTVGSGFAALGAGRLDQAHEAFVKARALKPNGAEAAEGLRRVSAALTARGFASMRQRAVGLEAQERWDDAEQTYADVLNADPSLAFAQEGKARSSSRSELSGRLQELIDRPDRLAVPSVREDALSLLETAKAQTPSGPVLRSQIARLEILLPGFNRPVRLALVSDNSTQVAIASIGSFGAFARREIELKPGKYTVVGTRNGFRDVRREITVAPGQEVQTIRVSCSEPI
jgi:hypothetical protein